MGFGTFEEKSKSKATLLREILSYARKEFFCFARIHFCSPSKFRGKRLGCGIDPISAIGHEYMENTSRKPKPERKPMYQHKQKKERPKL